MEDSNNMKKTTVLMVGAGPSALAASVYTTREHIETVLVEKGVIGGLAAITDKIDNYPGFAEGIAGLELADQLQKQAERFGAKIELGEVKSIEKIGEDILVKTTDGDYSAEAVLLATGSDYKKLSVPGEKEFYGRGVHYCATCDGAFYKDKKIIVVGGGNSAAQESLFLTRFSNDITVLVRSEWRASDVLVEEVENHDAITVEMGWQVSEIVGEDNKVARVVATHLETDKTKEFAADGVFVFVGLKPNTDFIKNSKIELDDYGFIKTDSNLQTTIPGVFASGDVRSGATMQIASAVGEGATAALKLRMYLENKHRAK